MAPWNRRRSRSSRESRPSTDSAEPACGTPDDERQSAGPSLASRVLALDELRRARRVAAYVSRPVEPPTGPLLDAWVTAGVQVLLPVTRPGHVLDWAPWEDPDPSYAAVCTARSTSRPPRCAVPTRCGPSTSWWSRALAADADGHRLGQGAGYYDRALDGVRPGALVVALLFDDEVVEAVPVLPHDRGVHLVVTPARVLDVRTRRAPGTP